MSIPDKAVEAADRAYGDKFGTQEVVQVQDGDAESLISMRAALEAAEPYLTGAVDVDAIRSVVVGHKAFEFAFTTDSGIASAQEALIAGLLKAIAAAGTWR